MYKKEQVTEFINSLDLKNVTNQRGGTPNAIEHPNSIKQVWFLDAQWSDLPVEIEQEVIKIWNDYSLGNDYYIHTVTVDDELFNEYPKIYFWCRYKKVPENAKVIIHWWW